MKKIAMLAMSGLVLFTGCNSPKDAQPDPSNSGAENVAIDKGLVSLELLKDDEIESDGWTKVIFAAGDFLDTIKAKTDGAGYLLKFNKERYYKRQRLPQLLPFTDALIGQLENMQELAASMELPTPKFERLTLKIGEEAPRDFVWVEGVNKYYLERNWISSSAVFDFKFDGNQLKISSDDSLTERIVADKLADWAVTPEITSDLWNESALLKYLAVCKAGGLQAFSNGQLYYSYTNGKITPILALPSDDQNGLDMTQRVLFGLGEGKVADAMASYAQVEGFSKLTTEQYTVLERPLDFEVKGGQVKQYTYPSQLDPQEVAQQLVSELGVELDGDEVHFKPGDYVIEKDYIIPSGLTIVLEEGARLMLGKAVSVLSYSSIQVDGGDRGAAIQSLHGEEPFSTFAFVGQGADTCVIKGLNVENGHESRINGLYFSGAFCLYHTNASLRHCAIHDNKADDGLNIKYGNILLDSCQFYKNFADQVDLDFCNGLVRGCRFSNNDGDSNGDGLDFSGALVKVAGCLFEQFDDKGISIGEQSTPLIVNNDFNGNNLGIAVKDMSVTHVSGNRFKDNQTAFALYRKKQIFGGSTLHLYGDNLLENNGKLTDADAESIVVNHEGEVPVDVVNKYVDYP